MGCFMTGGYHIKNGLWIQHFRTNGFEFLGWLVVLTILKSMSSSMGRITPYIMEKMFETTNQ